MKTDTLAILAVAVLGVFAVFKITRAGTMRGTAASLNNGGTVPPTLAGEIRNTALPGQEGYGWRYFSDGTSIGPDGSYYMGSTKVWSPL